MADKLLTPQQKIYVVKCNEFYKIGITSNVDNRLNSLRTGNPYKIELVFSVPMFHAKEIEESLHKGLKDYKHFREWFRLEEIDKDFVKDLQAFLTEL